MAIEVNKVERDEYELLSVAGGKRPLEGRKARHPGRLLNRHLPVEDRFLQFEAVEDGGEPPVVARPVEAVARDQASSVGGDADESPITVVLDLVQPVIAFRRRGPE